MNTGTLFAHAHGLPAMDYFHADRRPVWRRSPGPDAFLRRAIPVHGLRPARPTGKACATSRPASRSTHRNSITWASASRSGARRWPMPTKGATGVSHAAIGPAAHHPLEDAVRRRRTGVGPDQYRLRPGLDDHRSVPVGLSVGALPHHQGGGEDAHAARPAGQHSEFYPHLGWQAARRSCPRYVLPEAGPSTSWIVATSTLPAFMCCTKPGPSSSRVPSRSMLIASIRRRRIARPASFATRPSPWTASTPVRITPNFCGASASRTPSPARRWSSSPTTSRFRPPPSARSTKAAGRWNLFFKWIKQHLRIKQFYGTSENAVKTQIWIAVSVYVLVAIVKKRLDLDASLDTLLQILSVTLFEKMPIHQALAGDENRCNASMITNQLNLFDF